MRNTPVTPGMALPMISIRPASLDQSGGMEDRATEIDSAIKGLEHRWTSAEIEVDDAVVAEIR
jgi:hypothetical protein